MALTRSFLKGLGITDEQITAIIEAHTETTDALKEQRDNYKKEAETLAAEKKEHDNFSVGENEWKSKYEAEHTSFEKYKNEVTESNTRKAKEKAYSDLLSNLGINEKRTNTILKVVDFGNVELNEDGSIKGAEELTKKLKEDWSEFIPEVSMSGTATQIPPATNNNKVELDKLSMADYIKARQQK